MKHEIEDIIDEMEQFRKRVIKQLERMLLIYNMRIAGFQTRLRRLKKKL